MKDIKITERLEFLAKQFDVFDCEPESLKKKLEDLQKEFKGQTIQIKHKKKVLGLVTNNATANSVNRELGIQPIKENKKISICVDVFTDMVNADPTEHKMYLQWMLNVFKGLLNGRKNYIAGVDVARNDSEDVLPTITFIDTTDEAIRFAAEDLPMANEYLIIFEANKRKKKFRELSEKNLTLKHITDYSDINQYKSLSQLFDAVDPFIKRDPTEMESLLKKFVDFVVI